MVTEYGSTASEVDVQGAPKWQLRSVLELVEPLGEEFLVGPSCRTRRKLTECVALLDICHIACHYGSAPRERSHSDTTSISYKSSDDMSAGVNQEG